MAPVRIDPAAAGPGVHDVALPRRGGHQRADHRGHRSQVGDGRVQGVRAVRVEAVRQAVAGTSVDPGRRAHRRRSARRSTPCSAPPATGLVGRRRPAAADRHVARRTGARAGTAAPAAAGAARRQRPRRLDQPRRADYICRRLTVPPAEAYGVADVLRAVLDGPRPRGCCTSATTSPASAAPSALIVELEAAAGPGGARRAPRAAEAAAAPGRPCIPARPASGRAPGADGGPSTPPGGRRAAPGAPPRRPERRDTAPTVGASGAGTAGAPPRPAPGRARRPRLLAASAASTPRASTTTAPPAATRRCAGLRDGPGRRHPRGDRVEAARARRRRVPHRPQVGGLARQPDRRHYLVCNADESEPGTFKDRVLMEGDPFALIEAMTIAGFATGCERGYIYIRGEYPLATAPRRTRSPRPGRPASSATTCWAGVRFDIEISPRRGRLHLRRGDRALQLHRGPPRRAAQQAAVPRGSRACSASRPWSTTSRRWSTSCRSSSAGPAYAAIGTDGPPGTKLFCVSGSVDAPGVYEVPFGATLGDLLDLAGGVGGRRCGRAARRRAGAFVGPTSSTSRSPSRTRAPPAPRSAPAW